MWNLQQANRNFHLSGQSSEHACAKTLNVGSEHGEMAGSSLQAYDTLM